MTHFFEISPSDAFQAKRKILEKIVWPSSSSPFLPLFFHVPIPVQAGGDAGKAPPLRFTLLLSPKRRREKEKKRNCLAFLFTWLACLLTLPHSTVQHTPEIRRGKKVMCGKAVCVGEGENFHPPFFFCVPAGQGKTEPEGMKETEFFLRTFFLRAQNSQSPCYGFFDGHTTDSHKKIDKRSVPRRCLARFFLGRCFEITNTCWLSFFQPALSLQFPAFFLNFFLFFKKHLPSGSKLAALANLRAARFSAAKKNHPEVHTHKF